MYVARIRREEGAEKEEYLASTVGRSMALLLSVRITKEDSQCPAGEK